MTGGLASNTTHGRQAPGQQGCFIHYAHSGSFVCRAFIAPLRLGMQGGYSTFHFTSRSLCWQLKLSTWGKADRSKGTESQKPGRKNTSRKLRCISKVSLRKCVPH